MTEINTSDLFVIYSKGINGMSMEDNVYTTQEEAEKASNEAQERTREFEKKYIRKENMFTKFYVTTLSEYLMEYGEEMRWEGENRRE